MAQKLYRGTTQFWGKDLNEKAILGYVVAKTDLEVADHISKKYKGGGGSACHTLPIFPQTNLSPSSSLFRRFA